MFVHQTKYFGFSPVFELFMMYHDENEKNITNTREFVSPQSQSFLLSKILP